MSNTYIPERALFIYAHPDDIEFGVAGTAALWTKHGCDVTYIVLTDGNVGSHDAEITAEQLATTRRAEQTAAAEVAGATCIFLGEHDGLLQPTLELRKKLVRLIRQHRPNVIVCGDPTLYFPSDTYVNHPDHRAAAQVALDAAFPAAEMHLLYSELAGEGLSPHKVNYIYISWPSRQPNYYVDISETIETKIAALRQHTSQLGDWDPSERIKNWNAETGKQVGFKYAESYFRITLKAVEEAAEAPSADQEAAT